MRSYFRKMINMWGKLMTLNFMAKENINGRKEICTQEIFRWVNFMVKEPSIIGKII